MALTERLVIGSMNILEDGQIQLREDTIISRDGVDIFRTHHRRVLEPDQDVSNEANPRLVEVIRVVWTQEVIDEYKRKKEERERLSDIFIGRIRNGQ